MLKFYQMPDEGRGTPATQPSHSDAPLLNQLPEDVLRVIAGYFTSK